MTTQWLPFGSADMLQVETTVSTADGLTTVAFRVMTSKVGDIARFCFAPGSRLFWVATPADDHGVPLYPAKNNDGTARIDRIKVVSDSQETIAETISGVMADLDEYIRSVKALENMVAAEIYIVRP